MSQNRIIIVLLLIIALMGYCGTKLIFQLAKGGEATIAGSSTFIENFDRPVTAEDGKSFGVNNQLTFELFRGGNFVIDGESGYAHQVSESYRDSGIIRSTESLPPTYKISVVVGEIDYGLNNISGIKNDPEYPEGPANENGVYLISITDEVPDEPHTNIWWHQHRKVVIDVDNNVWGHGDPNPIFMVYFNEWNKLLSYDGAQNNWTREWRKGVSYDEKSWYRIELEKTNDEYIQSIYSEEGALLKEARVDIKKVWRTDESYDEYFVIGDPHENYYQGSMKIKSITLTY